jgi:hypothetical protein
MRSMDTMKNNDTKRLIKELNDEIDHLRQNITHLESRLEEKEIECDLITANLAEIAEYNQELETALAEAYLTSKEEKPTPA